MKKILSLILSAAMLCTMATVFSMTVSAKENSTTYLNKIKFDGNIGSVNTETGVVTHAETLNSNPVITSSNSSNFIFNDSKKIEQDKTTGDTDMSIITETIQEPVYTVTIPEKIEFGSLKRVKTDNFVTTNFRVTANGVSNLFANDKKLNVTVTSKNGFKISDGAVTPSMIQYKMYSTYSEEKKVEITDGQILNLLGKVDSDTSLSETINATVVLNTKDIKKAGSYSDIVTFTVALLEVNV